MAQPAVPTREDVWIPTACDMCYNACTIKVHRVDGVAVKIEGIPEAPPNYGRVCAKGNAGLMSLYNPHRLTAPLVRTNPDKGLGVDPRWKEVSWDEALGLLIQKLRGAQMKDPRSLVGLTFDLHSTSLLRAFMAAFGSPNLTAGSAGFFCGNGVHPVAYLLTASYDVHPDLELCDYLLMFGTSYGFVAQVNAMGLTQEMAEARARGMRLVVVDPVCTYAASQADEWIPIRPGTDAAFALSLMHVLVNELGWYDRAFLARFTNGPYLVGPDGHYLRDGESSKPLVWDARTDRPVPFAGGWGPQLPTPDPQPLLEGSYVVQGVEAKPGFQLFKDHLRAYAPENVVSTTTVPVETIRRIARGLGEAARIGSTIRLAEHELPLRPVVAGWFRGVSAHKHGMLNGMSVGLINVVLGAVDVPGGLLNANAAAPFFQPGEDPDGLLVPGNPFTGYMQASIPLPKVRQPETLELVELFPLSVYARAMIWLGILHPERFGLPYRAEVLIHCRSNVVATGGDPVVMAEALKRIPFMVSLATHHDETTQLADLVLPDTHALERLALVQSYYYNNRCPRHDEATFVSLQQPVVPPRGQARHWNEVLLEVAERLGILGEVYRALNAIARLEGPFRLDPASKYTWEEICDRRAKSCFGETRGLAYLREHGYCRGERRSIPEIYPRAFYRGRIPLYLEHFLSAGEDVKKFAREHDLAWDTSDYVPLVEWRPCPPFDQSLPEYDLFVVNQKLPFLTFSFTSENAWLMDLAERNTRVFPVGINAETARRKGIANGDRIILETPSGQEVPAVARLTQGVHPECLAAPGVLGRQITSYPPTRGKGVHFNGLLEYRLDRLDTLSAALDACVRVKVRKA